MTKFRSDRLEEREGVSLVSGLLAVSSFFGVLIEAARTFFISGVYFLFFFFF